MTERPILFSGPMVVAILAGTKTHTRRVVKPQPHHAMTNPSGRLLPKCPYGQPGDRLWVREAWQYTDWTEDGYPWIGYRADGTRRCVDRGIPEEWSERLTDTWAGLSNEENYNIDQRAADRRWRPGIHMPRWACRLVLEIAAVRAERLHAITDNDAIREGAEQQGDNDGAFKAGFKIIWESINGEESWRSNPWVWVVEFRRLTEGRTPK